MAVWLIGAGLCLAYYVVTLVVAGFSAFSLIWLVIGAAFAGAGRLMKAVRDQRIIFPGYVRWIFGILFFAVLVIFAAAEGMIIKKGHEKPQDDADYVIILGAQVRGDQPSQILYLRIMKAVEYLKNNPRTKVIASGGKGSGESITEAECMRRVLTANGIDEYRIIIEDRSVNTRENLSNSIGIAGRDASYVIATCGFHQYRAQYLAARLGAGRVSGIASRSNVLLLPNYYLREFFALIKCLLEDWHS